MFTHFQKCFFLPSCPLFNLTNFNSFCCINQSNEIRHQLGLFTGHHHNMSSVFKGSLKWKQNMPKCVSRLCCKRRRFHSPSLHVSVFSGSRAPSADWRPRYLDPETRAWILLLQSVMFLWSPESVVKMWCRNKQGIKLHLLKISTLD